MTVAYRILINTTVIEGAEKSLADSVSAVARHLDEIQQHTPRFLGFTLSADRKAGTARFSMYVDEEDPEEANSAAHAWAVTAINAAGDSTRGWAMFAHPEGCERVPA